MTRHEQIQFLRAELAEIARIEDAGGVAAIGMSDRRSELEHELRDLEAAASHFAAAELTFSGEPVVASRAIRADFAAPALQAFEKAVIALAGAKDRPLSARARLPGRGQNKLFVTSIAHGSFGFVLEELNDVVDRQSTLFEPEDEGQSPLAQAMQEALAILESSRAGDEQLAESLLDVDRRAVTLLREFTSTLVRGRAMCSLLVGRTRFRFTSHDEVATAYERLSDENIQTEDEVTVIGTLLGSLPEGRMFEIRLPDGKILRGKIDPSIDMQVVHDLRDQEVEATVNRVTVGHETVRGRLLAIERHATS